MKPLLIGMVMAVCVFSQTQPAPPVKPAAAGPKAASPAPQPAAAKPAAAAPKPAAPKPAAPVPAAKPAAAPVKPAAAKPSPGSDVDMVIQLVKSGVPEAMIVQTLRGAGKVYKLGPADLLKLTQAGVSGPVLQAMLDPKSAPAASPAPVAVNRASGAAGPASVTPVSAPVATGDHLPDSPPPPGAEPGPKTIRKRRLVVTPFDYSAVRTWVTFWFKSDVNIGQGIRAMMTVRMAKLGTITLLEREKADVMMKEQDLGASNRVAQGSKARIGRIKGADAILFGDIVIFGRDDVKKSGVFGAITRSVAPAIAKFSKEEKAVVGINYRIVDAETGEVIETGESRGESSRKSKDWGAILATNQGAAAGGMGMTSSNFEETIIGEATSDAVNKLITGLSERIVKLPEKNFDIEGRVATVRPDNTLYLNVGSSDGVETGDRFEVLQINGEVKDPQTGDVLDVQAEKVGEFVATQVRDKITIGTYGGRGLSPSYTAIPGKGYAARKAVAK